MNRSELFTQLDQSMMAIGKDMRADHFGGLVCSPAQKHVLLAVGAHETIHVKQLADLLQVTSGAATQHVDALEKLGLLERLSTTGDRRVVSIQLTREGKRTLRALRKAHEKLMQELFAGLSDAELQTLVNLITKASHTLAHAKNEGDL
jgi:DNA-binding MarR family transcriptional regulator